MRMSATPLSRRRFITAPRSLTPCGVSMEVGSSRISTFSPRHSARMISTCCCSPSDRRPTCASGSMVTPSSADNSRNRASAGPRSSFCHHGPPSIRFSMTERDGTSSTCWNTVPMPSSRLARGEEIRTGLPSIRISPSSGCCMPARMPISVDLPAPFSPSSTWISPALKSSETPSLATTPGKRLVTLRTAATGTANDDAFQLDTLTARARR